MSAQLKMHKARFQIRNVGKGRFYHIVELATGKVKGWATSLPIAEEKATKLEKQA